MLFLSCASASLPDSFILALMTAGSNPAESELFSSAARRRTNSVFAVRLTGSREAGLETSVTNVRFLTEIGPDNLAGYGRVYNSGTKFFDAVRLLLAFSRSTRARQADRRPGGSLPYSISKAESISRRVRCILPGSDPPQSGGSGQTLIFPHLPPIFLAHANQSNR